MLDDAELDAIEARAEAATEKPWWTGMHDGFSYVVEGPEADSHPVAQRLIRPDAEFIAHAREDVPALLRDLRAARQQLALPVQDAVADHERAVSESWDAYAALANAALEPLRAELGREPTYAEGWPLVDAARRARDADLREGEWEYGTEYEVSSTETVFTPTHSREQAEKWVAESPTDTGLRRRRPAGQWQAVLHPAQDEAGHNDLPRVLLTHPSDGHPAGETCLECRTPAQPVPDEGGKP